jgi:hypothetical protein
MKEIKIINKEDQEQERPQQIRKEVMKGYELVQIPTQHVLQIETPSGELITIENAIVELLNSMAQLKRSLIG